MPFLRERSGRWSPEKIVAFVGAVLPILWLAWRTWTNDPVRLPALSATREPPDPHNPPPPPP